MSSALAEKAFVAAIVRPVSGGLGSGLLSGLVSGVITGKMTAVGPFDVTRFYGCRSWHPHTRAEENKRAGAPGPSALGSPLQWPDRGGYASPGSRGLCSGVGQPRERNGEERLTGSGVPTVTCPSLPLGAAPGLGSPHGSCGSIGSKRQGLGYVCLKRFASN